MFDALFRDIRFGLRLMLRQPGFTLLAVCAIALGIGCVTTMLSVINGAVWKGLPFAEPQEIVSLSRYNENRDPWDRAIPYRDFEYILEHQNSYEEIVGYFGGTINLAWDGEVRRFQGSRVTRNFVALTGETMPLGRPFLPEEDSLGASPVAILSHATWRSHFGADPQIVGKTVRINGAPGRIVGVMPARFGFPSGDEVWIPLHSAQNWRDPILADRYSLNVIGRLRDGVSLEAAEVELSGLLYQLAQAKPERNQRYTSGGVLPFSRFILGDSLSIMWLMTLMAAFVLLIACTNVANLLLARSTLRSKELAIRSSLGASRQRIVVQLLTESLVLAFVGALLGLGLAHWAAGYLMAYREVVNMPFWFDFGFDWRIFLLVAVFTFLTGLLSGLVPALRASKANINDLLKDDTRTGTSFLLKAFGLALVVFQVTVSCVALICAGLMMKSLDETVNTEMHFDTEGVFVARMGLFEGDYPDPAKRHQFFTTLKRNLEARPEVSSAALYTRYRWTNTGLDWPRVRHGREDHADFLQYPLSTSEFVSWDYFETLGIPLLEGRSFTERDCAPEAGPVVIVNEAFARSLFPEGLPIGKRFQRAFNDEQRAIAAQSGEPLDETFHEIIGVVPNMAAQGVGNDVEVAAERHFFLPLKAAQTPMFLTVAATGPGSPLQLQTSVREEVQALDPNLPIYAAGTPAQLIREDTQMPRLIANIFKVFGALAAILAAIGIYGVVSFSVNQRTQEFGIRAALGAVPRLILRLILWAGAWQIGAGLALGLALGWAISRGLRSVLYRVSHSDPSTYVLCALFIALVALVAMLFPARRAARIHPAQALRHD
jgi:putative ABC transport system permease protein